MNKAIFTFLLSLVIGYYSNAQTPANWTSDDLMEPAMLASLLAKGEDLPVILSVGPGATIPQSKHIGATNDAANLATLKKSLAAIPKTASVVIYCGCCPFEHCPNVRPAIAVLQEMQFADYKLLNLPKNLKTDWIDKGYPTVKQ